MTAHSWRDAAAGAVRRAAVTAMASLARMNASASAGISTLRDAVFALRGEFDGNWLLIFTVRDKSPVGHVLSLPVCPALAVKVGTGTPAEFAYPPRSWAAAEPGTQ